MRSGIEEGLKFKEDSHVKGFVLRLEVLCSTYVNWIWWIQVMPLLHAHTGGGTAPGVNRLSHAANLWKV